MNSRLRRLSLGGAVLLILAAAAVAVLVNSGGHGKATGGPASADSDSLAVRFATLSAAGSNQCSLQAAQVMAMPEHARLQGSCCFPMNATSYRRQLHGLRPYASMRRLVPSDPYDVSVGLVKRLLTYRDIPLTPREQAAYTVAIHRSDTQGPCCCRCWRWQAFKGQAHYLLHRLHFSGARVGRLWDLEQGCGGPSESKT
jgi:hypothetical protein